MMNGAAVAFDNFSKFCYARNVSEERNRCINGAVLAVVVLPAMQADLWLGWRCRR
jgi:hypothetical protein